MPHRRVIGRCVALAAVASLAVAAPASAAKVQANTAQTDKSIAQLKQQIADLGTQLGQLKTTTDGLSFIAAAAPQIIDGLTQLKNGLQTLGDAYQAVEYGVAQVNLRGGGAIVNPPGWSADIPDDGNGATVSGFATVISFVPTGQQTVTLNAYIRSNEADRDNGPVGQAGGAMTVTGPDGSFTPCIQAGGTAGVAITPTGEPIQTPSGPITDQPLTNILKGMPRTSQAMPGGDAPTLATCTFTGVGGGKAYTIHWTASFLDIPTSSSPGPRD
jgi:hypothetical protein